MNTLVEVPNGLLEKIMKRIRKEERLLVLRKVILFSTTLIISLVALIPSFKMLALGFAQSGFFNYFSLAFSDSTLMAKYWQNFAMMLLETLPVASLALFVFLLLTILQSIKSLRKNIKVIIKA